MRFQGNEGAIPSALVEKVRLAGKNVPVECTNLAVAVCVKVSTKNRRGDFCYDVSESDFLDFCGLLWKVCSGQGTADMLSTKASEWI